MATTLTRLSPILWTKDLQATIDFYTTVLGFTAQSSFPDFVSLIRDSVELMFVVPQGDPEDGNEFFPKPRLTGSIYITCKDVDGLWEKVKDKVKVKSPLCDTEYHMRDFAMEDNNGYEVVFGQLR